MYKILVINTLGKKEIYFTNAKSISGAERKALNVVYPGTKLKRISGIIVSIERLDYKKHSLI